MGLTCDKSLCLKGCIEPRRWLDFMGKANVDPELDRDQCPSMVSLCHKLTFLSKIKSNQFSPIINTTHETFV